MNDNVVIRYPFGIRNETELEKDRLDYPKIVMNTLFRNRLINLKHICWDITTEGNIVSQELKHIIEDIKTELKNQ